MTQQPGKLLDDIQADAGTAAGAVVRSIDLIEFLEDVAEMLRRDPDAGIPDLDPQRLATAPGAKQDPAGTGVPDRVGQQVAENPFQQAGIATDRRVTRHDPKFQSFGGGQGAEFDPQAAAQLGC